MSGGGLFILVFLCESWHFTVFEKAQPRLHQGVDVPPNVSYFFCFHKNILSVPYLYPLLPTESHSEKRTLHHIPKKGEFSYSTASLAGSIQDVIGLTACQSDWVPLRRREAFIYSNFLLVQSWGHLSHDFSPPVLE